VKGTHHFQSGRTLQEIVLKSLMLLACVMKLAERLRTKQPKMYDHPLLLTLVNSVNTEDADLKRFFRELERPGKGEAADSVWQAAKTQVPRCGFTTKAKLSSPFPLPLGEGRGERVRSLWENNTKPSRKPELHHQGTKTPWESGTLPIY
jgi:hypothetical protein